ncbi:endonuclease/exonuclease/phosphatase family protein [Pantoea ananatis]|uniref:endonuclease/exonuclease/phosphatase family protein n=1 Tax=Pantoea ananas TaxID=553 RepID=UPI0039B891F5
MHAGRHADWPAQSQYEFLADTLWPQFAYGRNAVYPHGHHGNALLSRFPIASFVNRDVSIAGHEHRGLLHAVLEIPGLAVAVAWPGPPPAVSPVVRTDRGRRRTCSTSSRPARMGESA